MATPHIEADKGEIAEIVLMPGDPLRAKFIADNYLSDIEQFNKVRNMFGYTGYYKGKKVSVMGSGMGMPSIGIYAHELYNFYNVEKIIRLGSCGANVESLNMYDLILVNSAYSESTFAYNLGGYTNKIVDGDKTLIKQIEDAAKLKGIHITKGMIMTSDTFYAEQKQLERLPADINCIAAEMEAFGLFYVAKHLNKKAACILTVVNSFIKKIDVSAQEREQSLTKMIELALESI
ncbi:MAG: purine-nucleoside phosphorylase [Bacilli bacterium]|nr:purine-nucleoside phosphorylase [Bacilli bacterium]